MLQLTQQRLHGHALGTARPGLHRAPRQAHPSTCTRVPSCSVPQAFGDALRRRQIVFGPVEGVDPARLRNPHQLAGLFNEYHR